MRVKQLSYIYIIYLQSFIEINSDLYSVYQNKVQDRYCYSRYINLINLNFI